MEYLFIAYLAQDIATDRVPSVSQKELFKI